MLVVHAVPQVVRSEPLVQGGHHNLGKDAREEHNSTSPIDENALQESRYGLDVSFTLCSLFVLKEVFYGSGYLFGGVHRVRKFLEFFNPSPLYANSRNLLFLTSLTHDPLPMRTYFMDAPLVRQQTFVNFNLGEFRHLATCSANSARFLPA